MSRSPFVYDLRELGRRPGSMRELVIEAEAPEGWGLDLVSVPAGTPVVIDARFESVMDGVLVTAEVEVPVSAECGRCLDPLEIELVAPIQELYAYEPDPEDDDALTVSGDALDLEPVVRDAVVLALPLNPLCDPDCLGLCAGCGARLADVEPGHTHDEVDPRWAALALLRDSDSEDSADLRAERDPEEK
ncbi:MAG TPA: YceD family protein [Mycobacteriales bacterium]|nr:YceD family protein [Mycobacteriales bacterium]